ncbi:hypothetical protein [Olleya sp. YS]|uniref:hypothetical protein n=1 Tax=Olleya sp. YS TaxID=3028318 RepID=UPI00243466D7|nr:hypothetical protein [Olleya sp. YS]WGD34882.1 hypothetical protein Ollyesu_00365 [Olleya sp. YS]
MISKIKRILREQIKLQRLMYLQSKELEWAQIYHDSIRGKKEIENLPINVGRWAGNYTFFYLLNRILSEYKPEKIIEFGLGESTKFISTFLDHYLSNSQLLTIEHDDNWKTLFLNNFKASTNSKIEIFELTKKQINGHNSNGYKDIESKITEAFDLYIVDGPFGSPHFSRHDIVALLKLKSKGDEFMVIIDDYERIGEKETTQSILDLLKLINIEVFTKEYVGNKSVFVIATKKYKYVTSF